ncbi:MAG: ribosome biogenesis GTP-binding protein YihA/YsxC [Bacteroidota bacterium]|nr:ribosome biogenesis GTP-binding protein YihA/YsxC [Bacteroidota bacterium]
MQIKETRFITSSPGLHKCPPPGLPEYAFIGRSNVGKSSLLNMITDRKKLAKISSTPGKTQLINHFIINEEWYLVDLPGYGYARISVHKKQSWGKMIRDYIMKRKNLMSLFLLIDSRIPPQQIDLNFIDLLGINQVPFVIVFTKSDKLSKPKLESNLNIYKKQLLNSWEDLPEIIVSSSTNKTGREEILSYIGKSNKLWKK